MSDFNHQELIIAIAQCFYYSRNSISEIAKQFKISRYYVEKYLDEATNEGLVNIQINAPISRQRTMERLFKQIFPNEKIIIVKDAPNPTNTTANVFLYAAQEIQHSLTPNEVIGLSWGETIYDLIQHFNTADYPNILFTQIMGENMKYNSKAGSMRLVEMAANRLGAKYQTMVAPLYVFNDQARELWTKEPAIKPTLALGSSLNLIICSLGNLESLETVSTWKQEIDRIIPPSARKKVAGLLYGRPFDLNGNFINEKDIPVFSMPIKQILKTPKKITVVTNKLKAEATLGAMRGQLLNTFYLSESVASKILILLKH
ncbi:MAG: sugar-binding transcriptional regulator [Bombilactobacillus mellifer]|nr:sugar-binding transcriptional regulator [Bombilactobacillus mellifer]